MFSGRKNQTDLFKRTKAVCLFLTRFIFFYFPNYFLSSIFLSLFLKAHDFLFSFILDHVIVFLTKSEILFSFFFLFWRIEDFVSFEINKVPGRKRGKKKCSYARKKKNHSRLSKCKQCSEYFTPTTSWGAKKKYI